MSSLDFFHIDTGMNLKLLWFMHLPCLALEMFIYEHRFAFHFVWIGSSESWNWHREDYCLQKDPNSGKFLFCFIICLLVCNLSKKFACWFVYLKSGCLSWFDCFEQTYLNAYGMECLRMKKIFPTCLMKQPPSRLAGIWLTMFLIVVSFSPRP